MQDMLKSTGAMQPLPNFIDRLQKRIINSGPRPWLSFIQPYLFKPVWVRAAMIMLLMLSTAAGFFLGGRLEAPAAGADAAVFYQTMNLDAFTDLPANSFGAVYDSLLQGELQ